MQTEGPQWMFIAVGLLLLLSMVNECQGQQQLPVAVGNWTWVSGGNSTNQVGSYGSLNVAAAGNVPGSRFGHCMVMDSVGRAAYLSGGLTAAGTLIRATPTILVD